MTAAPTLPRLSRTILPAAEAARLDLPERAVQFGTGAFLRGFIDFFVDAANRAGAFNGRVVAVGSTGSGRDEILEAQDGLYTLVSQGMVNGAVVQDTRVISSVSRALSANAEWDAVLAVARSPELALVFSNTTEVGIALDASDTFEMTPPRSFPAKLARFLYERAQAFDFDPAKGVVVVPCELIEDNGAKLKAIVRAHAERWALDARFGRWLDTIPFCDTLVDRIVPGAPKGAEAERLRDSLGYEDGLMTTCEPYRLFAIRGDAALKARLGFVDADPGIVVADDITPYRELKVRLLNGTHTAFVPAALLAGCETVREAVEHPLVGQLVRRLMFDEIAPTVPVAEGSAEQFARDVLDRFSNPFIRHALVDITLQATMKTRVRLVPTIQRYAAKRGEAPPALAFGLAAYLMLQRPEHEAMRKTDDQAGAVRDAWAAHASSGGEDVAELVRVVLSNRALWDADLTEVPGFGVSVTASLLGMLRDGVPATLEALLAAPEPK